MAALFVYGWLPRGLKLEMDLTGSSVLWRSFQARRRLQERRRLIQYMIIQLEWRKSNSNTIEKSWMNNNCEATSWKCTWMKINYDEIEQQLELEAHFVLILFWNESFYFQCVQCIWPGIEIRLFECCCRTCLELNFLQWTESMTQRCIHGMALSL